MKIKSKDYDKLKEFIGRVDRQSIIAHKRLINGVSKVKDIDKRLRWDVFYACGLKIGDGVGVEGDLNLYAYLDDSHIDTALKYIMKELKL